MSDKSEQTWPTSSSDQGQTDTTVFHSSRSSSKSKKKGDGQWTRITRACDRCRRLKVRCDAGDPCFQCCRAKQRCHFYATSKSSNVRVRPSDRATPRHTAGNVVGAHAQHAYSNLSPRTSSSLTVNGSLSQPADATNGANSVVNASNADDATLTDPRPDAWGQHQLSTELVSPIFLSPRAAAEAPTDLMPMLNEAAERRWAGESCYAASSTVLKSMLGHVSTSNQSSGLPGTDDSSCIDANAVISQFRDARQEGFPEREDAFAFLDSFLDSVHCIFAFVHAKLCRSFFEKLYFEGTADVNTSNKAAHLAILSLGWHSSWTSGAAPSSSLQNGLELHERGRDLAFSCIGKASIPSVVALVASTLFQQATRQFESAWATFGICVRQAQALGLHRDTPRWEMSPLMREARRSTWLNIYTLDTFLSICYGRPPAIDDRHCDAYLPVLNLDDFKVFQNNGARLAEHESPSLMQTFSATPSRAQFHLLKAHLCRIARRILNAFYLCPKSDTRMLLDRSKWDMLQSILEDLYELGASIPDHLQVVNIDQQQNKTFKQQAACLDILINHVIILAYKPFVTFEEDSSGDASIRRPENVGTSREKACKAGLYAAACAICSMVVHGRDGILSTTIQLILSSWGIYTTAAELIAHHAISTTSGSAEAREAYENLASLLRQFAKLRSRWPSAGQEHAILQDLVRAVRSKIQVESRLPSPETTQKVPNGVQAQSSPKQPTLENGSTTCPESVSNHALFDNNFGLQWFDEFLESGNLATESGQAEGMDANADAMKSVEDLYSFVLNTPSEDAEYILNNL